MNVEDQLEGLRYLSQIHRNQFDERSKYSWKAFFTLITFYVLCGASKLNGRVPIPDSIFVTGFFFVMFGVVACVAIFFLADLHTANQDNKEIAENAEQAIMDILGGGTPKISKDAFIPLKDELLGPEKKRQIFFKDLFKFHNNKRGVWIWRWQVIMICIFAFSVGIIFMTQEKSSSGNTAASKQDDVKLVIPTERVTK